MSLSASKMRFYYGKINALIKQLDETPFKT